MSTPTGHATGPRTAAGKAVSARNATRHGLLSPVAVLGKHESAADWQDFCAGTLASLVPVGCLEHALAERIAHLHWRLTRIARYEAEAIDAECAGLEEQQQDADRHAGEPVNTVLGKEAGYLAGLDLSGWVAAIAEGDRRTQPHRTGHLPSAPTIELIMRYEAHLSRELTRAMRQLDRLQAGRVEHLQPEPATPCPPTTGDHACRLRARGGGCPPGQ